MSGIVKLERYGEVISEKKFISAYEVNRAVASWKTMYGKGFDKCQIVIKKDEELLKTKSPFKKGSIVTTFKKVRVSRGFHRRHNS